MTFNQKTPSPKEEVVHVQFLVTRIAPDRTAYKQYGIELTPVKVAVSVPIPARFVSFVYLKNDSGEDTTSVDYVVLTLEGLTYAANAVADAIDSTHNAHLSLVQKGVQ